VQIRLSSTFAVGLPALRTANTAVIPRTYEAFLRKKDESLTETTKILLANNSSKRARE
jgi:hypothetical protein